MVQDLNGYMANSINRIMVTAGRAMLRNPREALFALRMRRKFRKSKATRERVKSETGIDVPPFLIASIATTCNLHCKGCYARQNGIAADDGASQRATLSATQWREIFNEAAAMGINFALLAGGEPLTRRDLLEEICKVKEMIFPVFTNGTMMNDRYIEFFRNNLNMVPVVSLEGDAATTDSRRGTGIFRRAAEAMKKMDAARLFYGISITVTTENMREVTSEEYIQRLRDMGCRLIVYVEYVPTDEATAHLALGDAEVAQLATILAEREAWRHDMLLISFPGDEKNMGGCLAAGRGFFHIGPDGAAEPCPFSPYSDSNVATMGLKQAMNSPLFRRIRGANALDWKHTGGCTLYEHRDEVEAMLNENRPCDK
ncbi:MAG: radical SAM protein [Bacteroidales bacterium]|nr:radical SAM protein [Bacteroidales bacterium]